MRPIRKIAITVAFVTMSSNKFMAVAEDGVGIKVRLDALARASAAGGLDRVEVFRLPKGYESMAQVQPEDIEALWYDKMILRELRPVRQDLISRAIANASVQASTRTSDLRWGIVFYWPKDRRIVGLYFDETGRHGSLDSMPVSFGADFFLRLKNALHLSLD